MTQVVVFRVAKELAPFGRKPDACVVGRRTLAEHRHLALARSGLANPSAMRETSEIDEIVTGPAMVLSDDLYISPRALRSFRKRTRGQTQAKRFCLPPHAFWSALEPLQDIQFDADAGWAFPLTFVPEGSSMSIGEALSLPAAKWMAPEFRFIEMPVPRPPYILKDGPKTFPITSTMAMRVRHWVHLLRLSHVMPQIELLELATQKWWWGTWSLMRSVRVSAQKREQALKRNFVFREKGVFIHKTACVEASYLGRNVHIGPYAYVVGSVLADDVYVEDRAHVHQSCLGPKTFVSRNSSVSACVAFGDTDVCTNGIQACVIAEKCGLTSFARPLDLNPRGPVSVMDEGVIRSVGALPCGVAFGPGVFVGADVTIAPGRQVPAGVSLYASASQTLRRLPELDPDGGEYTVHEGTLKKI